MPDAVALVAGRAVRSQAASGFHSSTLAEQALKLIGALYNIEREIKDVSADERLRIRQLKSRPAVDLLHAWLTANRQKVPDGT